MGLSPPAMSGIFSLNENSCYNIRSCVTVNKQNVRTRKLALRLLVQFGAIIWNDLPAELKKCRELEHFLKKLWSPNDCPCKICINKIYKKFGIRATSKKRKKNRK